MNTLTHRTIDDLTWWDWFQIWVETDATQLGLEVTTYYFICSLVGAVQGMAFWRFIFCVLND